MRARWQPFEEMRSEMSRLQNEVNRVFGRRQNGEREFTGVGYPPLNMWEDDGHYFVEAELPGLAMEDLEILVTSDNQLSIAGERKQPATKNGSCVASDVPAIWIAPTELPVSAKINDSA